MNEIDKIKSNANVKMIGEMYEQNKLQELVDIYNQKCTLQGKFPILMSLFAVFGMSFLINIFVWITVQVILIYLLGSIAEDIMALSFMICYTVSFFIYLVIVTVIQ